MLHGENLGDDLQNVLTDPMVTEMTAAGGVIVLGIGLPESCQLSGSYAVLAVASQANRVTTSAAIP